MAGTFGPSELLDCYARGVFPMADGREDNHVFLMDPEVRAILPLDGLHISKSMRKWMRTTSLHVRFSENFPSVIEACATDHGSTWISYGIEYLYTVLHEAGHAHSVEVMDGDTLVGGLYGVSLGGAFFGESMFSRQTNASKFALIHLVQRLNAKGFVLLDCQFMTDHLASLGAVEIPRDQYKSRLSAAIDIDANFTT